MMKKLFFLLIAMAFAMGSSWAQTLNEDFEGTTFPPEDWKSVHVAGSVSWQRWTLNTPIGTACAGVNTSYSSPAPENLLITPKCAITSGTDTLKFVYKTPYYSSYGSVTFSVLVSTTDDATSSFNTTLFSITSAIPSAWTQANIPLSQYVGQNVFIAFKVKINSILGSTILIDNVTGLDLFVPSCPKPRNVLATNSTSNTVDLSWNDTVGTNWTVQYMPSTYTNWANSIETSNITTNPYTLTSINPSESYKFRIKSVCSATDESDWSATGNFRTLCGTITNFPWVESFEETFDSVSGQSNVPHPSCWTNIDRGAVTASGSPYFISSTTAYHYGTHSVTTYTNGLTQAPNDWLVSPQFALTSNQRLKFWARNNDATTTEFDEISVWISNQNATIDTMGMGINDSLSNFTRIFQSTIPQGDWREYEINLSSYSGNRYIAFVRNQMPYDGNHLYLDDIEVSNIPTCSNPISLITSNITTSSVDLAWNTYHNTDSAWYVYYKPSDSINYDSIRVTTNPYTLTGLISSVTYNSYVRTDCGLGVMSEEKSNLATYKVKCTLSTIPYTENFDSYATQTFPACWNRLSSYAGKPWVLSGSGVASSNAMAFYANSGKNNIAVSPELDVITHPMNTLSLTFQYKTVNESDSISVGIMTDPNDFSTFTKMATFKAITINEWYTKEINFSSYTGSGAYIAFYTISPSNLNTQGFIDNITVDVTPSCPNAYSLSVVNTNNDRANLIWDNANSAGLGWQMSYALNDTTTFDPSTGTLISIPDTIFPYTLTGLTPGTIYTCAVRQNCSGGLWSNTVTVHTIGAPAILPYTCNFETLSERNAWEISNGIAVNKWVIGQNSAIDNDGHSLYISNNNGVTNSYNEYAPSSVVASRLIQFDGSQEYLLTFNSRVGGHNDYLKVFLVDKDTVYKGIAGNPYWATTTYSQGALPLNGTNVYFNNESNPTNINSHSIILPSQGDSSVVKKLIFVWANDSWWGVQPPASIDSITITPITCLSPISLNSTNVTYNSADISWTNRGTETNWTIQYKLSSQTNWDSAIVIQSTINSYSISGLTPLTTYNVRVKAVCAAGTDESFWTSPISFTTACGLISSFPWIESFENTWIAATGVGNRAAPQCWTVVDKGCTTNTTYWWHKGSNVNIAHSGIGYAYIPTDGATTPHNDWLITPQIVFTGNQRLSFWAKNSDSTTTDVDEVAVFISNADISLDTTGMYQDSTNMTGFTQIFTQTVPVGNWHQFEIDLSQYSGIRYLAFVRKYNPNGDTLNLDDIEINPIISCFRPTGVIASNIATTNADISWTNADVTNNSWYVYYKASSAAVYDSIQVSANPYSLQNLMPATSYSVYVKTNCSNGLSIGSDTATFQTECPAITFPWSEGFENGLTCWTIASSGTSVNNSWRILQTGVTPSCTPHSGSNMVQFNCYNISTGGWSVMASPALNLSADTAMKVTYWMYKTSSSNADRVEVFINSTPDTVGATLLGTDLRHGTVQGWSEITHLIPSTAIGTQYIVLKAISGWGNNIYIDDLTVEASPCIAPTSLTVTPTTTTALVTWIAGGEESSWQIRLGSNGNLINTTTTLYNLMSLTSGTTDTIYVRANCGNSYSNWVSQIFTTLPQVAPTVTTNITTSITQTLATLNASYIQGTDTISSIGFEWKPTNSTTWTSQAITPITTPYIYNLTSLTASTSYDVRAYVITATEGTTYGTIQTFTTLANVAPIAIASTPTSITQTTATFNGTITAGTEPITAFGFEYKLATSTTWTNVIATGSTNITSNVTNLIANTNYEVRAYAQTSTDTVYSNVIPFTTLANVAPIAIASTPTSITQTTATFNGTITAGTEPITAFGFEYKLATSTTWTNVIATGSTNITSNVTNLIANTNYEVRAYAQTSTDTVYSNVIPFTTLANVAPIAIASTPTSITQTTATFNGTITAGTEPITAFGFEYKLATSTTWTNVIATGTTSITANVTNLIANTNYEVRAYARTSTDTVYSDVIPFTTLANVAPIAIASTPTSITQTTATFNGTITAGTEPITLFGFEYKLATSTTWTNVIATGTTSITANVTNLIANTNYEVRAYAQTSTDTVYSDVIPFTTLAIVSPTVTTSTVTNIMGTSAIFNGTVIEGTETIISKGFEYKADSDTTWIDVIATGTENITASVANLTPATNYKVRAYAQTSQKYYGNEESFITTLGLNDIEDSKIIVTMYPNPAESSTKLVINGVNGNVKMIITDVQGRTINTINAKALDNNIEKTIDVSNFAKGVYYVRIINNDFNNTQKLIVK